MRRFGGGLGRSILVAGLCAALLPAFQPARAAAEKHSAPGLWIAADRIVGFVPFSVYVYGKVAGIEPGHLELCRTEAAWIAESANSRKVEAAREPSDPGGPGRRECAEGKLSRTPEGYDYAHDMRFDRPGTYQIRLVMIDRQGERTVSNSVRVRAF